MKDTDIVFKINQHITNEVNRVHDVQNKMNDEITIMKVDLAKKVSHRDCKSNVESLKKMINNKTNLRENGRAETDWRMIIKVGVGIGGMIAGILYYINGGVG